MDDKNLKSLQDIEAPLPTPHARDAAMRAGLQAFEQVGEKKTPANQGSANPVRLIFNAINTALEWTMKQRTIIGVAAIAAIAVPVTFKIFEGDGPDFVSTPFSSTGSELKTATKRRENKPDLEDDVNTRPKTKPLLEKRADKKRQVAGGRTLDSDRVGGVLSISTPAEEAATTTVKPAVRPQKQERRIAALPKPSVSATKRTRLASSLYREEKIITVPGGYIPEQNRDQFAEFENNPLQQVAAEPVSTFSIDVDTSSYAFARKLIQQGRLPQKHAVRTEEMINYFNYNYPRPETAETPFRSTVGVYPAPWNPDTKLIHIGIKGYDISREEKPRANLVFLLDVSGSMNAPDKLPLLKSAFRLLVDKLDENDTVSIVTYAGRAGTVLEPTKAANKQKILNALDNLRSGGSTAGAQGIRQAYALAEENLDKDGVNRVILATDGDFNVGIVDRSQLKDYIAKKRKTGVFLSILGFGAGNYNDALMQTLAQNGNGNAAYIDNLKEAQKVLVEEAGSTLFPIAKDVKIQVEFNPALVSDYRLVGYETRALKNEDFNNDKVDAGDIGSGHTVTAIYEITPVGAKNKRIDPLRYRSADADDAAAKPASANADEYAFLKLRYKLPKEDTSKLVSLAVTKDLEVDDISKAPTDMRFAASVAAFGQKLRGSTMLGDYSYDQIADLATTARGDDKFGYRHEFVSLVRLAKSLN